MMLRKILARIYYQIPTLFPSLGYVLPCRNVVFELTYNCNLDCQMCSYQNEIKNNKSPERDFKPLDTEEIISLLHEFPKGSNVAFTGGEVFVKKGALDILEAATKLHKVSLATNGTLVTEEIAGKLVSWGIKSVGLSLDGPKDIHNKIRRDQQAYNKLMNAIYMLNEQKKRLNTKFPRLNLNGVILKENIAELYKNLEVASKLDIAVCTFQVVDPSWNRSGWRLNNEINIIEKVIEQVEPMNKEDLTAGLKKLVATGKRLGIEPRFVPPLTLEGVVDYYDNKFGLNNWRCLEPWSTMRISPYGDIFPCLNFRIGNVREQKPAVLWNSPSYRNFRKTLARLTLFDSCVGCCKMIRK